MDASSFSSPPPAPSTDIIQNPEFRSLLAARLGTALGGMGFATLIGYQIYQLTKDPLALGWLGLVQAIPALSLALLGGYIADRYNRRSLALITLSIEVLCMLLLMFFAMRPEQFGVTAIYAAAFLIGMASGFQRPAIASFEQQVIPNQQAGRGFSYLSSVWQAAAIAAGPLTGLSIEFLGIPITYFLIALCLAIGVFGISLIASKPTPPPQEGETIWESLSGGVRYVLGNQPLVGSMALDLFAVLFGGAMALLPIFAEEILQVGAFGLGVLRTAPSVGALLVMLIGTRYSPSRHAGRNLLWCVGGFGVSMIVFGLSHNFWLSFVALFFSGLFDGISMIIRTVIVQVLSPEQMRGRINAVSWIFIGASNEIGAFESGVAAKLLGTMPSVYWGGTVTLLVVAIVAATMPKLRALEFKEHS